MTSLTFLKKTLMATTGATVIALVGGEAAQAVTFNFGEPNGRNRTEEFLEFSEGNIDLTVTGLPSGFDVTQRNRGLGVTSGPGDQNQVDGTAADETLVFTFDQRVTLTSVLFDGLQNNDGFKLFVDGNELVSLNRGLNQNNPFDFIGLNSTGKEFKFTVAQNNDDYFVRSIDVEPVPEPLTILGSLSALGIGTVLKKRQKNS